MNRTSLSLLTVAVAAIVMLLGASPSSQAQSVSIYSTNNNSLLQVYASNTSGSANGSVFEMIGSSWFYGSITKVHIDGNHADLTARGYLSSGGSAKIKIHVTVNAPENFCSYRVKDSDGALVPDLSVSYLSPTRPGFIAIY